MRRHTLFILVAIALLAGITTAFAQERPVTFSAAPIVVAPLSGSGRQFDPGMGIDLGVAFNLGEQFAIAGDYVTTTLGAKDPPQFAPSVAVAAEPRMQFGTANFVFRAPPQRMRIYITGGVGLYHRSVTLTATGTGPISICNPWWFVCYPNPVLSAQASGTRSHTDLGVNVGAGFTIGHVFAEIRYHYVWGPAFDTPRGSMPATGKFLPLVVGVQF